jgi:hypothetical protein
MLGKLIKYELKGTAHYFLPLFGALLIFSILIRLFSNMFDQGFSALSGLLIFVEVLLIIAVSVMVLVITIQRFYKNLLGNEGYLMFTLPVSTHHNILSKLLTATIWNIATMLVVTLAIIIMIWQSANLADALRYVWENISYYTDMYGLNLISIIITWAVVCLINIASNILLLYLAMAIGQLANEHKFLASFGAYIAMQFAIATIVAILGTIASFLPPSTLQGISEWIESLSTAASIQIVTLTTAIISIAVGAVYYFLTHWLLKRKLNLA